MTEYNDKTPYDLLMLDNILQYAPAWIYWKDINSIHLGCNEQFAIAAGFKSREEMVGKSDYECAWGNRAEKYNLDDAEVVQSGKPKLNIEDTVLLKDGQEVTVISNKVPLRNANGEIIGVLGIATDISHRKRIEKELLQAKIAAEAANQAKSEFIANMSHDIRTPLTGILGLIQELIDIADDTQAFLRQPSTMQNAGLEEKYFSLINQLKKMTEKVQEDGQLLIDSADELLQLLNEILETMRLESGKTVEQEESFNLYELVEHNVELMQPLAQHKKLTLSYEIEKPVPVYYTGLRNYLDRTLLNLLSNALKFTEQGFVKVTVKLLNPEESPSYSVDTIKLKITVEDSGVGIKKDKFATIFEHFSRLTPSYQGVYKGAGLGLYTVKHYIEAMKSTIKVESEIGKGTSFTVNLSLKISDHSDHEKISFRKPKARMKKSFSVQTVKEETVGGSAIKILIVEDNQLAARAAQYCINRLGYSGEIAENGVEAVQKAESNDYDLILMDIGLPDIDGIEATKQIRALKHAKLLTVPIVALTGHACDPEKRKELVYAGMQEVLSKPLQQQKLEDILQRFVFNKD
jgi:two-component system aerobic respiration control sensor histidine kinase ArcB